MRHNPYALLVLTGGVLVGLLGFLIPFWPLQILAVFIFALGGQPLAAIGFGTFLDLLFGRPPGFFAHIYFPFTALALLGIGLQVLGRQFFLSRKGHGRL